MGKKNSTTAYDEDFHTLFPYRLHKVLSEVEEQGMTHIVSWLPCGKIFKVHNAHAFTELIMPRIGRFTRFKSFLRQMNMYKFERITDTSGPLFGAHRHPYFRRGHIDLCRGVLRGETYDNKKNKAAVAVEKKKKNNKAKTKVATVATKAPTSKSIAPSGSSSSVVTATNACGKGRTGQVASSSCSKTDPSTPPSSKRKCCGTFSSTRNGPGQMAPTTSDNARTTTSSPSPFGFIRVVSSTAIPSPPQQQQLRFEGHYHHQHSNEAFPTGAALLPQSSRSYGLRAVNHSYGSTATSTTHNLAHQVVNEASLLTNAACDFNKPFNFVMNDEEDMYPLEDCFSSLYGEETSAIPPPAGCDVLDEIIATFLSGEETTAISPVVSISHHHQQQQEE